MFIVNTLKKHTHLSNEAEEIRKQVNKKKQGRIWIEFESKLYLCEIFCEYLLLSSVTSYPIVKDLSTLMPMLMPCVEFKY